MGEEEEQLIMNTVIIMQVSVEIRLNWNWPVDYYSIHIISCQPLILLASSPYSIAYLCTLCNFSNSAILCAIAVL